MRWPSIGAIKGAGLRIGLLKWLCCFVLGLVPGCQPPSPTELTPATHTQAPIAPALTAAGKEYWDAYFFDDIKVGYGHTQYQNVNEQGELCLEIVAKSELTIHRFGQTVKQQMEIRSVETPAGEVRIIESKMGNESSDAGSMMMTTVGRVHDNQLQLEISTLGKTVTSTIPWEKTWGGFFAMEQSLERQPMKPGEKRILHALVPGFNQVADVEYEAVGEEQTKMLEGQRELLRINTKIKIGDNTLEQTLWTDAAGQTVKSYMPALKQTSYRTTKEIALSKSEGRFDLGERTIVVVDPKLEKPHQTRRARYRITFADGNPFHSFASGSTQSVRKVDAHTVELDVRSLRPTDALGTEFPADQPPTDDDLAANSLIQSDDAEVVALAGEKAAGANDFWEIVVALEQQVRQHVSNKSFSQALASAADVARSREGDCTEHAVLLAALCRAKQIPARVAIGMVYFPAAGGFAYHMWTEAWNQDRWIPLDATLGLGGIGAAHLKVSSSNLKGADPFSQFLPVFQLIGNIQIKVISYE